MSTPPWGEDAANNPTPESGQPQQPPPPQQPYQPYGQPGYGQPTYGVPAYGAVRPTNGMAIASLVVSIAGLVVCCGAPSIIGAILGHVSRGQIKRNGEQGDGLALAGIIVGWIAFGIFGLIALFYAGIFVTAFSTGEY
ncbi:MAG: DUF4190 domain-containing protein [Propionibacteriales bacterium]|nr:DUF4190 domain-containing protein [Propionibacteriales bacterium]